MPAIPRVFGLQLWNLAVWPVFGVLFIAMGAHCLFDENKCIPISGGYINRAIHRLFPLPRIRLLFLAIFQMCVLLFALFSDNYMNIHL